MSTRLKLKNVDSVKAQQHPLHIFDTTPLPLFMATAIVLLLLHIAFLSHPDYPIHDEGIFLTKLFAVLLTLVLMFVLSCSWHKVHELMFSLVERWKLSAILTLNVALMQPEGGNGNKQPSTGMVEQGINVTAKVTGKNPSNIQGAALVVGTLAVAYAAFRLAKAWVQYLSSKDHANISESDSSAESASDSESNSVDSSGPESSDSDDSQPGMPTEEREIQRARVAQEQEREQSRKEAEDSHNRQIEEAQRERIWNYSKYGKPPRNRYRQEDWWDDD